MANPEHVEILKQGVEIWNQWRKDNPDIKPNLNELQFSRDEFERTPLWRNKKARYDSKKSSHINLNYVDLSQTELVGADLSEAQLTSANLSGANLFDANLERAWLQVAILSGANLDAANLKGANLSFCDLSEASLRVANLTKANMTKTNIMGANLSGASLRQTFTPKVQYDRKGLYKGVVLEGCHGSELFRRHALHQAFIEEFRESGGKLSGAVYWIWNTFVDCGRSPWRLMKWIFAIWLLFAEIFFALQKLWPGSFDIEPLPKSIWTMIYYSIVTLTTLGFGDVTPLTYPAMIFVSMEVVLGYIILGCLISFLSSKMVPRG